MATAARGQKRAHNTGGRTEEHGKHHVVHGAVWLENLGVLVEELDVLVDALFATAAQHGPGGGQSPTELWQSQRRLNGSNTKGLLCIDGEETNRKNCKEHGGVDLGTRQRIKLLHHVERHAEGLVLQKVVTGTLTEDNVGRGEG